MLIITNRNFKSKTGGADMFGDKFNEAGPDELRMATAKKPHNKPWELKLLDEPSEKDVENGIAKWPSEREFLKIQKTGKPVVVFVHGFNQTFEKNLNKALKIEKIYECEVVVFSWPAHPKVKYWSKIDKKLRMYKKAKRNAKSSIVALDRTFEKLNGYLHKYQKEDCDVSINLLIHSLGNLLFEHYVRSSHYASETQMFDNVILHQADADHKKHHKWVDKVTSGERLYITLNEKDKVLRFAMKYNMESRIGNKAEKLNSREAIYVNFTGANNVGTDHGIFKEETRSLKNKKVLKFFAMLFKGEAGHTGLPYDADKNFYKVG